MTNSISTTVVELMKNIHDTVIMPHDSQCQSQPHDSYFINTDLILCQVIMTKTLTGYDVLVYVKVS